MALSKIKGTVIADNAINADRIADGTVVASDLLDNTITGAKLASDIAISTSGNITTTGAFTSTGIDDNATSTAITIDSSENVGIGTSSPSTALDVTGTVTADGLTVETEVITQATAITLNGTSFADTERLSIDFQRGSNEGVRLSMEPDGAQTVGDFVIETGTLGSTSDRLRIEGNGDISFYEDTGTTPKFFWDASAERLGIGTTGPDTLLHLSDTSGNSILRLERNDTSIAISDVYGSIEFEGQDASAGSSGVRGSISGIAESTTGGMGIAFSTAPSGGSNTEVMRIDRSGKVGIGTASPNVNLDVVGDATSAVIEVKNNVGQGLDLTGGSSGVDIATPNVLPITFATSSTERMRIASSGNLIIGDTTEAAANTGKLKVRNDVDYSTTEFEDDATILIQNETNNNSASIVFHSNNAAGSSFRSAIIGGVIKDSGNALGFYGNVGNITTSTDPDVIIKSGGNVGIGTTSPQEQVDISSTTPRIRFSDTSVSNLRHLIGSETNDLEFSCDVGSVQADSHIGFKIDGSERMRIDSSGNVGIGTSSPNAALDLAGEINFSGLTSSFLSASQPRLYRSGSSAGAYPFDTFGHLIIQARGDGSNRDIIFATGSAGANKTVIDSSGKVGIGTSSPSQDLEINKNASNVNLNIRSSDTGNAVLLFGDQSDLSVSSITQDNSSDALIFKNNNQQERMRIDSSGKVGIGTSSPLQKLQINVDNTSAIPTGALIGTTGADVANGIGIWNTNNSALYSGITLEARTSGASRWLIANEWQNGYVGDLVFRGRDGASSSSEILRLSYNGNVGIGTSNPQAKLNINTSAEASVPALGSDTSFLMVGNDGSGTTNYGTMFGTVSNGNGYIQQQRFDGTATSYNLLLQPNGGNVGIGTTSPSETLDVSGNVTISGSLSKGSGSFKIDHPLPEKTNTHHLVHSFVEAPQADNIYRGKINLVSGTATVNIDTVAGMSEGTFVLLNTNIQCFTSNETGWTAVKGSVSGNTLTITAQDNTCTDTISWMVIGERQDQHMYDTEWTDENGKVIVEPLKPVEEQIIQQ